MHSDAINVKSTLIGIMHPKGVAIHTQPLAFPHLGDKHLKFVPTSDSSNEVPGDGH